MTISTIRQATAQRGASTLAGHYYTSHRIFEQEGDRIFDKHWLCVGRSEQIPETGDYFLAQVGDESLIILRDTEGTARAFFNVCRQRGTRLCSEPQGHFVDAIRCPYHNWTYTLEGQLCTTRLMPHADGSEPHNHPLYACALHEWEGFLWVNLAPNPAPFAQTFAPLLSRFTPWRMTDLRSRHQIAYAVPANWKLIFQNYAEGSHLPFLRSQLARRTAARNGLTTRSGIDGQPDLMQGAFLGGYVTLNSASPAARSRFASSEAPGNSLQRVYYYLLFPTLLLTLHPQYVVVHRLHPQSADRTQVVCEWLFDPLAPDQPEGDPIDAIERWDLINRQCWQRCEMAQQGMGSRAHAAGRYVSSESLLAGFDREYLRIMGR